VPPVVTGKIDERAAAVHGLSAGILLEESAIEKNNAKKEGREVNTAAIVTSTINKNLADEEAARLRKNPDLYNLEKPKLTKPKRGKPNHYTDAEGYAMTLLEGQKGEGLKPPLVGSMKNLSGLPASIESRYEEEFASKGFVILGDSVIVKEDGTRDPAQRAEAMKTLYASRQIRKALSYGGANTADGKHETDKMTKSIKTFKELLDRGRREAMRDLDEF